MDNLKANSECNSPSHVLWIKYSLSSASSKTNPPPTNAFDSSPKAEEKDWRRWRREASKALSCALRGAAIGGVDGTGSKSGRTQPTPIAEILNCAQPCFRVSPPVSEPEDGFHCLASAVQRFTRSRGAVGMMVIVLRCRSVTDERWSHETRARLTMFVHGGGRSHDKSLWGGGGGDISIQTWLL